MAAAVMNAPTANGDASEVPAGPPVQAPTHNSSLYVGDLDRDVTEAQLFELFAKIGPVASIRVCRDAVTRRSLGYAYVNYNAAMDATAADRALELLNYTPLGGKPMRIMWSLRDPATRKSGVGNIFIKNLDKSIDNKALHDTFTAFGNILSCKVALDSTGQSRGYGFVHFEKQESAQTAMEKVNGMLLEGKKVYVGPFLKSDDRPANHELKYTNVFVKNLPENVDDEQLMKMFAEHGSVTSAVVMKDEENKSRGFGFVNFDDADGAHAAVAALNGKDIDGKELYCGRAQKKSEREAELKAKFDEVRQERIAKYQGMNLYVKNLTDEVDDAKLREQFQNHGTITSAKVMKDGAGKSKGFGFVCFSSPEEATRAVTIMNGHMLHGKPMYVAIAQRREIRRAQLEQQYTPVVAAPVRPGPVVPGRAPTGPPAGPPMPGMFPPHQMNAQYPPPGPYYQPGPGMPGPPPRGPPGGPGMGAMYPQMGMPPRGMPGGRGGPMPGRGGPMPGRGGQPPFQQPGPYGPPPGPYGMPPQGPVPFPQGQYPPPGPGPQQRPNMNMGPRGPVGPRGPGPMGGRGFRQQVPGQDHMHRPDMPMKQGRGGPGRGRGQGPSFGPGPGPQQAPPPQAGPPAAPAPSAVVPGTDSQLTTAMLAAAAPEAQKQMLGERLFPQVQEKQPELAGKITGMLLEMDNSELLLLLESRDALEGKVQEAIAVLKQHNVLAEGPAENGP